ncbi:MAG: hypothetical protein WC169_11740 [Dehalococcoidia bacterium]|jgi:hypothetical protein
MEKKRNVMCSMCISEYNGVCLQKKNVKVHPNKKRSCDQYLEDKDKVEEMVSRRLSTPKPEVTFRPDWYWDKNLKRKLKRALKEQESLEKNKTQSVFTGDSTHPLTGDLSRFIQSTVKD